MKKRACFLDRDGVIIEDAHYLSSKEEVQIIPQAAEALKKLKAHGYECIVVTNQSGVARGYYCENTIKDVHGVLLFGIAATARLVTANACPCGFSKVIIGYFHGARNQGL